MKIKFCIIIVLCILSDLSISAKDIWVKQNSGISEILVYVDFLSPDYGFALGGNGALLKTIDGGLNWEKINTGYNVSTGTVDAVDQNTVFICGENGLIIKSIDAGKTWTKLNTGVSVLLYSINFVDKNIGYSAGIGGTIIKTIDGGSTWTQQNSNIYNHIYRINFLNKDTGFVAAKYGDLARTFNGGITWTPLNSGTTSQLNYVKFYSKSQGYIIGDYGTIKSTTDLGNTWTSKNSGTSVFLNCVSYAGLDTAYVVGMNGTILKTTNAGNSWVNDNSGVSSRLVSICMLNPSVGYAVGESGTILKLQNISDTITRYFCASDPQLTLTANNNFKSYIWTDSSGNTLGSSQTVVVNNPVDSMIYYCSMISSTGETTALTFLTFKFNPVVDFNYDYNCLSNTVSFLNLSESNKGTLSYKWDFGDGTTSTEENPKHDFTTTGIHQVTLEVSNSPSDCTASLSRSVETFISSQVAIAGDTIICTGGTGTTLKGTGADKYEWSTGSTEDSIKVGANGGRFWMIGYSKYGCVSDTVFCNVKEESDWNLNVAGNTFFCKGGGTVLKASGASRYVWSTGERTDSIIVDTAGTYSVEGYNVYGCEKTFSLNVQEMPLPSAEFYLSGNTIDIRNNQITCSAPAQTDTEFKWEMGDGSILTGNNIQYSYNLQTPELGYIITLTATTKSGCTEVQTKTIEVIPFIPNVITPNGDGINDRFMVDFDVTIYDRNGIKLYKGFSGWDGTYKGKPVDPDTYFYLVSYKDIHNTVQLRKGYVTVLR